MASSFLPRLSLSKDSAPLLPFYGRSSKPALRTKPSEYDLADLSPRSDDAAPASLGRYHDDFDNGEGDALSSAGVAHSTMDSPPSKSPLRSNPRVLFSGPPPPIASSALLNRDFEDGDSTWASHPVSGSNRFSAPNAISSVLFRRGSPSSHRDRDGNEVKRDTVWQSLQRRERSLQKDIQRLLDVQSTGLSAGLGRPDSTEPSPMPRLAAGDSSGGASSSTISYGRSEMSFHTSRSRISLDPPTRATAEGEVLPVRQPPKKPMGLRAARAGLGRSVAMLADLKAEEDALLAAALSTRKTALARIRTMSARRDGLAEELRALESDDEEPLSRELRDLGEEHRDICEQISELEETLAALRNRRRRVQGEMDTLKNRREAGLSGYRGALRELEAQIAAVLRRPPVSPLDLASLTVPDQAAGDSEAADLSLGGPEFLRMRPERRTATMAKEWWEKEVELLERRKAEVDKDRTALEEGAQVWKDAVKLVSDFETNLRREMTAETGTRGDGTEGVETSELLPQSQEEKMRVHLEKMQAVVAGLEDHVQTAERNGWTLLICAIGAELEAFREAELMLRDSMRTAGIDVDEDTPRLSRSVAETSTTSQQHSRSPQVTGSGGNGNLVDLTPNDKSSESDNEVPADLLVAHADELGEQAGSDRESDSRPSLEHDTSDNEIPPEFLQEHRADY